MFHHRKMQFVMSTIVVLILAALIVTQSIHQPAARAASMSPAITISGSIGAHDPSRMIKDGNTYYVYATGYDIPSLTSTDRIHWTQGKTVLPNGTPAWARTAVPGNDGHDIWAPDVIYNNGLYYLYYAIAGGKDTAIGLVTSPTLNPSASNYNWTDRGEVIGATSSNRYATIDPAPYFDTSGNMWLSWGSGYVYSWSDPEIFEIRLNKSTGLRADNSMYAVVNGHVEASYVYYHSGYYYLFWNTGGCCSGTASTYLIHVARSTSVTGPYVGSSGAQGSSNTFLASYGDVHGPGQIGILDEGGTSYYTYHYYNASGNPVLGEDVLGWSNGWPTANGSSSGGGGGGGTTYYKLVNRNSGQVLDISGASTSDGGAAIQWPYSGATNQQWQEIAVNGGYKLVNRNSGKVLDDPGGSRTNGTQLDQWSDTNGSNQWWNLVSAGNGYYYLVNQSSGLYADVNGRSTAQGAAVIEWSADGGTNQQWQLVAV